MKLFHFSDGRKVLPMSLLGGFMERLMWQVVCGSACPWLTLGGNNWQVILELKYSSSCPHLHFPHFSPLSTSERAEMAWTKAGDRRRRRQERREGKRVVETQKHCRCGHPNIIISAAQTGPEDQHASPLSSLQASQASSLLPQSVFLDRSEVSVLNAMALLTDGVQNLGSFYCLIRRRFKRRRKKRSERKGKAYSQRWRAPGWARCV